MVTGSPASAPNSAKLSERMSGSFSKMAHAMSNVAGSAPAFVAAVLTVVVWAALGPTYHYSDTWQLVINTGTTIVTFLMVFMIQNTQNRDAKALHLKLDELIRAQENARNSFINLEQGTDRQLEQVSDDLKEAAEELQITSSRVAGKIKTASK
jgi:low affinity Fe/Cu permease